MANTSIFSIRTQTATLDSFDAIITRKNLSRSKVIESFMLSFISENQDNKEMKLVGGLSKFRGAASKLDSGMIQDDPRAIHALCHEK